MNKSSIFKRAHELRKLSGLNMSEALTQAWNEAKLQSVLDMDFSMFGVVSEPKKEVDTLEYYNTRIAENNRLNNAQKVAIYKRQFC